MMFMNKLYWAPTPTFLKKPTIIFFKKVGVGAQ